MATNGTESSSSDFSVISNTTRSRTPKPTHLSYGQFEGSFFTPDYLTYYATQCRNAFSASLDTENVTTPSSYVELFAQFLLFVVDHGELWESARDSAHAEFVESLLDQFERDLLKGDDVHKLAQRLPGNAEQKTVVVKAYYAARSLLERPDLRSQSALFRSCINENGSVLYAVFGGQGNTEDYLSELRELYDTYTAIVEPLLASATKLLQSLLLTVNVTTLRQFSHGLDVMQWLRDPESTPASEYLVSAPVSFPMIGLLQLANYTVMCRIMGMTPGEATKHFKGMAGHSQGVVVATAVAMADSWSSFDDAVRIAITILFYVGSRGQEITSAATVPTSISQDAVEKGEGFPTPMLNVSNCSRNHLQKQIDAINEHLEPEQRIAIGLVNGRTNFVVSGPIPSLCALNVNIRKVKAGIGLDQSRINFSARKPEINTRYLPISASFHSSHLEEANALAAGDLSKITINGLDLQTSVFHTHSGADLSKVDSNIVPDLVRMILVELADWPKSTVFKDATHVVDFGPGGSAGVGVLVHRNKEGTGVRLILMSSHSGTSTEYGYRHELFDSDDVGIRKGSDWVSEHSPRLIRSPKGELRIVNAMTRMLGMPPIMVAGMTPCTVPWDFVSAITKAGYHVELAGGGYNSAEQMSAAISKLHASIPVGRGICVNLIYASPRAIRWQIPMIQRLRSEGVPIDGLTFGAGVPSIEVANEYITTLGLRYLALKPGSVGSIEQVLSIARANPEFPIMLQWTGGRGGGHHSFDDFHDPIVRTYGKIRRCKNVVLVAGSGFGGAEDTYPYLTGTWSLEYAQPLMPFDGCLFGSRMMVAKEAHTSKAAKEAIVAAPGIEDPRDWEKTYQGEAGGIITVKSEMGEPIHKLATRGVLFWREMDDKIFSITDKAKRLAELQKRKAYIIKKLNDDFQKVWFGRNDQGQVVDVQDMTYAEILRRLVQLLYVKAENRWIDPSYIQLTEDFVRRMEARLPSSSREDTSNKLGFEKPYEALKRITEQYPIAEKQVITFDDAEYFMLLCRRPGQKPVTFVPDLDEHFETWFKKDSLWQSEDIAAVVDQDAGRTCILQGPLAARFSTKVDEPVSHILNTISQKHIEQLLEDKYHGDKAQVPTTANQQQTEPMPIMHIPHCRIIQEPDRHVYSVDRGISADDVPPVDAWFRAISGKAGTWRHDLLNSNYIFQGHKLQDNPIRRIVSPAAGIDIQIHHPQEPQRTTIIVLETSPSSSTDAKKLVEIRCLGHEIHVNMIAQETAEGTGLPLTMKFSHHPEFALAPIHEAITDRNDRLRKFYYRLWFGSGPGFQASLQGSGPSPGNFLRRRPTNPRKLLGSLNTALRMQSQELATPQELHGKEFSISSPSMAEFHGSEMTLNSPSILSFADSVGESRKLISSRSDRTMAPLDFAIVVGWEAMMKAIFPKVINGDFLKLVHLSNRFQLINDAADLSSFDRIECTAKILSIKNTDPGRVVEVGAIIRRDDDPVLELVSEFLFRGTFTDFDVCFQKKPEPHMHVTMASHTDVAVLRSKPWMDFIDEDEDLVGQRLVFQLETTARYENATTWRSVETSGQVFIQNPTSRMSKLVASVDYQTGKSTKNPVMEYLSRHGTLAVETRTLDTPQPLTSQDTRAMRVTAPASNKGYARASGDYNPIHVSRIFASYANLPGTITHGMYTSACVRQVVEKAAGLGGHVRMKSYKASFVGMVLPGDVLEVQVDHVAMKDGLRVLSFKAKNVHTGDVVLKGDAEVDQAVTTYIFTGQGSQVPGMGMELYAKSEIAREIWDTADRFFSETYGFKISQIVKENPKELTIWFGGRRGHKLRQSYMNMKVTGADGEQTRFFKHITDSTTKHVFRHKQGLLFSTEFAQPALTIVGRAQYMHLKAKGLLSPDAFFAGHSLGEYTALSTIAEIMTFENLLATVFYRGLTMQAAVERDSSGRSKFAMVAVNPSRISRKFTQPQLQLIVRLIREKLGALLEVVNYNVEGQQYVAAGELTALDCLGSVTTHLAKHAASAFSSPPTEENFSDLITSCAESTMKKPQPITLVRGAATIPLEGIDVPFHSSFLLPKMPAFRQTLKERIPVEAINPDALVGKYVSNVTGMPFELSREYLRVVYERTNSGPVKEVLEQMGEEVKA